MPRFATSLAKLSIAPSSLATLPCRKRRAMGNRCLTILPAVEARGHTLNSAWRYSSVTNQRRLGRGLEALLGRPLPVVNELQETDTDEGGATSSEQRIAVGLIDRNPFQ